MTQAHVVSLSYSGKHCVRIHMNMLVKY